MSLFFIVGSDCPLWVIGEVTIGSIHIISYYRLRFDSKSDSREGHENVTGEIRERTVYRSVAHFSR